jgi:two-component system, chemotaxis family, response regulator PixG
VITVKETSPFGSINLFTASKQIQFLKKMKDLRFSGELVFTAPKGEKWSFYLYLGSIIYATGGTHPVRRWQRHLAAYCPQMPAHNSAMQRDLEIMPTAAFNTCWQYQLLCLWVAQQKITAEQAAKIIRGVVVEVLFDIAQARHATFQIKPDNSLSTKLPLRDVQEAIAEVEGLWQAWSNDPVADYSPNSAPVIKQPEHLKECASAQVYQTLSYLLNGKRTVRDVALLMKRDILSVTRSLLPYIQSGSVELLHIPDLPVPVSPPPAPVAPVSRTIASGPLILCVDDSPAVCQSMESLLVAAGYRFVGVQDGLRAIATILARRPDVIFLDLVMPNTNGYEICAHLRKLSQFQNTPIIILTGNDGVVDRVRAKLVGASDFLSKPVDAGVVLSVIRKHLKQGAQGLKV